MDIILKQKEEEIKLLKSRLDEARRENSEIEKVFQMSLEAVAVERDEALKLNKGMDDLYLKLRNNVSSTLGPSYSTVTQKNIVDGISALQSLIDKHLMGQEENEGCYETCQSTLMHLRSCFETRMALQKVFADGHSSSSSDAFNQEIEQCAGMKGLNQNQIEEQVGKMYQLLEKRDWATEFAALRKENIRLTHQCQHADAQLESIRTSVKDLVTIFWLLDQNNEVSISRTEEEGEKLAAKIGNNGVGETETLSNNANRNIEGDDQGKHTQDEKGKPETSSQNQFSSLLAPKDGLDGEVCVPLESEKGASVQQTPQREPKTCNTEKSASASVLLSKALKGILETFESTSADQNENLTQLRLAQEELLRAQAVEKVKLRKAVACLKRRTVQLQGKLDYWKSKYKELEEELSSPGPASRPFRCRSSEDSLNSQRSFALRVQRDPSVDSSAGSTVGSEWSAVSDLDPPPKTAANVNSPIVKEVLNNWVNSKKKQVFEEWIQYIMDGGDVTRRGPGFAPALQISNLQPEVYQGFVTLVVPLLLRRKDISVSVSTKEEVKPLHDLRVVVQPIDPRTPTRYQKKTAMQSKSANQLAMKAAHSGYVEEGAKPYSAVAHTMKYGLVQTITSIVGGK